MIREDIRQLKTGERELRRFGLLVGGVFTALGVLMWLRGKPHFLFCLVPGLSLVALGLSFPRSLKHIYIAWMSLAFVLGFVVSHLILTLFFFLVVAPIGLVARLFGKDFLGLKLNRNSPTYWIRRDSTPKSPEDYERQF